MEKSVIRIHEDVARLLQDHLQHNDKLSHKMYITNAELGRFNSMVGKDFFSFFSLSLAIFSLIFFNTKA